MFLSDFFDTFLALGKEPNDNVVQLRVCCHCINHLQQLSYIALQDYPPTKDFQSHFREYFDNFEASLPMPSMTTSTGMENLAAHWPYPPKYGPVPQSISNRPDWGNISSYDANECNCS